MPPPVAFEQMLMMSSTEDYREQLREWREDGGRHSDEVRRNPEQIYFRGSTGIFTKFCKIVKQKLKTLYSILF